MISFCKFHGFGNDYIVFEDEELKDVASLSDFAVRVCRRHTGIGGDGIAVLEKISGGTADYSCRIINPDGSEAGFSGNGTRCAAAYLHYKNLWRKPNLRLETRSGVKNYELLKSENSGQTLWFRAELGKPKFDLPNDADRQTAAAAREKNLETAQFSTIMLPQENLVLKFFYVDVGNPVACIFVDDFDQIDWRRAGRIIEARTEVFPERTNVVFIKTHDMENIEIRIWERGAGETSSSGTCSVAAAVVHLRRENLRGTVQVHAAGGTTEAVWREEDDEMLITGRADLTFCGEIQP
ncbi:MAG TPA: diaminopimelate epimerase [Pyrinomonadaceae bacterium]|nr:diaminopimelate epimerase [Pyrinomonadaceae bacterium]